VDVKEKDTDEVVEVALAVLEKEVTTVVPERTTNSPLTDPK
jgi:hypothetical protein